MFNWRSDLLVSLVIHFDTLHNCTTCWFSADRRHHLIYPQSTLTISKSSLRYALQTRTSHPLTPLVRPSSELQNYIKPISWRDIFVPRFTANHMNERAYHICMVFAQDIAIIVSIMGQSCSLLPGDSFIKE
jgi:hypothetical protein